MTNRVLTFLSKLGSVLSGSQFPVSVVGGLLAGLIPGTKDDKIIAAVTSDLTVAVGVIGQVEAFGQALSLTGPDKLKAAAGPMAQVIMSSAAFAGKKIANPILFQQGATKVADGLADCLNAINPDELKTAVTP